MMNEFVAFVAGKTPLFLPHYYIGTREGQLGIPREHFARVVREVAWLNVDLRFGWLNSAPGVPITSHTDGWVETPWRSLISFGCAAELPDVETAMRALSERGLGDEHSGQYHISFCKVNDRPRARAER